MNILLAVCGSMAIGPNLISMLRDIDYVNKIVGIDIDLENPGRFLVDTFHQAPKTNNKNYINFVKNICKIEEVDVILCTSTQNSLIPLKKHEKEFNDLGVLIPGTNLDDLLIANDKGSMLKKLSSLKIKCPDYCIPKTKRDFDYFIDKHNEVVVKPRISSGSRGFKILEKKYVNDNQNIFDKLNNSPKMNSDEYKKIIVKNNNLSDIVMMKRLYGQDYSIYSLADKGNPLVTIPFKRLNSKEGISLKSEVDMNINVIDYVNKIIKSMNLDWIVNLQLFLTDDGIPYIYEINPRVAGSIILTKGANCNILKYGLDLISNKKLNINKPLYSKMIRYYTEVLV